MNRPWMRPITFGTEDDFSVIIPSRGLKLIGLRFYTYEGTSDVNRRKAKCIQKSLYERKEWFYFNKGFKIHENQEGAIEKVTVEESAFDSNQFCILAQTNFRISVLVLLWAKMVQARVLL